LADMSDSFVYFCTIATSNTNITNNLSIQGVSEFDRQTFRADSMTKNKHTGSKMLKSSTNNKRNRVEFFDETYKNKKELCTIYKNCQNFAPLFNAQITP
jgi:hypothetical protein